MTYNDEHAQAVIIQISNIHIFRVTCDRFGSMCFCVSFWSNNSLQQVALAIQLARSSIYVLHVVLFPIDTCNEQSYKCTFENNDGTDK